MHPNREHQTRCQIDGRHHPSVLFASLELSRSTWLVSSLSPGSEKMSKHASTGGDGPALLALLARLHERETRTSEGSDCRRLADVRHSGAYAWPNWSDPGPADHARASLASQLPPAYRPEPFDGMDFHKNRGH